MERGPVGQPLERESENQHENTSEVLCCIDHPPLERRRGKEGVPGAMPEMTFVQDFRESKNPWTKSRGGASAEPGRSR